MLASKTSTTTSTSAVSTNTLNIRKTEQMTNVKPLHSGIQVVSKEPNAELIKALDDLLALAKSGELQSFLGTGFDINQNRISMWCDFHINKYEMLGAVEFLKTEWLDRNVPFEHDEGDET